MSFAISFFAIISSLITISWTGKVLIGMLGAPLWVIFASFPILILSGFVFGVFIAVQYLTLIDIWKSNN